jgi:hypothetical protein
MDRVRLWLRASRPFLFLLVLYWFVSKVVPAGQSDLALVLVLIPTLIAGYVWFKVGTEQDRHINSRPFELSIVLGWGAPKCIEHHPAMARALEVARKKNEELKAAGREEEFTRLFASGLGHNRLRFVFHHGLLWSEQEKTFVHRLYATGRYWGHVLGPEGSAEADVEPSVLVSEKNGVVVVMLVPVEGRRLTTASLREECVSMAFAELDGRAWRKDPSAATSGAIKLAEFPVAAFMDLIRAPDNGPFDKKWHKAWDALEKKFGLLPPPKTNGDDYIGPEPFQFNAEYVAFFFDEMR